jgi:hypothetical protein
MNTQTPVVRRLLPFALACGLLAALTPAAQAQIPHIENSKDKAGSPKALGSSCGVLVVVISGSSAAVTNVSCLAEGGAITASVSSGNATLQGKESGSFPATSGLVWFSLGF